MRMTLFTPLLRNQKTDTFFFFLHRLVINVFATYLRKTFQLLINVLVFYRSFEKRFKILLYIGTDFIDIYSVPV